MFGHVVVGSTVNYKLECIEDCGYAAEAAEESEVVDTVYRHIVSEHDRPVDPSDLYDFSLPVTGHGFSGGRGL